MSQGELPLRVLSRSGRELASLQLKESSTVGDLKDLFQRKSAKHYEPNRQLFTIGLEKKSRVVLTGEGRLLTEFGLRPNDSLIFKDLGLQISWRSVFLIEYFGPILVHSLLFFLPSLFYPQHNPSLHRHTFTQKVALACVVFHYVKRELETVFVHRFSNDTMPVRNIFKNSFYYWVIGGAAIAYFLYHPLYTETYSPTFVTVAAVLFVIAELANGYCHLILRWLRPEGSKTRGVPRGFLFEYVTCANYTCEVTVWLIFAVFTHTLTSYAWALLGLAILSQWSLKRHVQMKKEFGAAVPKRKILIPFIW